MIIAFISFFIWKPHHKEKSDETCYPQIILKGNQIISLKVGEEYEEPGYALKDSCGEKLENRLEIQSGFRSDMPGTYEIIYKVSNQYGNFTEEKRFIMVKGDIAYQD